MEIRFPDLIVSANGQVYADLTGNWLEISDKPLVELLTDETETADLFLLPLSVSFHRGEQGTLWLDWSEAGNQPVESGRLQITLSDRLVQVCNEIRNRHSDSHISIHGSDLLPEKFIQTFSLRLTNHLFEYQWVKL